VIQRPLKTKGAYGTPALVGRVLPLEGRPIYCKTQSETASDRLKPGLRTLRRWLSYERCALEPRNWIAMLAMALVCRGLCAGAANAAVMVPRIVGDGWTIAGDPDLGAYTNPKQEPVDFGIWQAADGSWQLWSCIRGTACGGNTRLFHRWEGRRLTDTNWTPRGIAMEAKPEFGETPGGLQAPFVFREGKQFLMFYGDWEHICAASSDDGKTFTRRAGADGKSGMFGEGPGSNTRDPMVLFTQGQWHCYYTAHPQRRGADYCRTSKDTRTWSDPRVVARGGASGTNAYSAECPFVLELTPGEYYLFRTQRYGRDAISRVYHSRDPLDFGLDKDAEHLVGSVPVAAPEIFQHDGQWYVASLLPSLKGIRLAKLEWVQDSETSR